MAPINMRLEIYDTSKFAIDPKAGSFIMNCCKYPDLALKEYGEEREKYLTYITIMYDKHSDLRLNKDYTYWQKKKIAAEISGFILNKNGRFNEEVEKRLLSEDPIFINAMMRYLRLQFMPEFIQLCVYEMLHDIIMKKAMIEQDNKLLKEAMALTQVKSELEETIFGGHDTSSAKEALYEKVGSLDLGIRAEDIATKLERGESFADFSKFGNYVPDDLTFAGDEKPEDY